MHMRKKTDPVSVRHKEAARKNFIKIETRILRVHKMLFLFLIQKTKMMFAPKRGLVYLVFLGRFGSVGVRFRFLNPDSEKIFFYF